MIKEAHWKIMAQCLAGTLMGMIWAAIGFAVGLVMGINVFNNYETGAQYGAILGIIIGAAIGTLLFHKLKIKSYKNISITGLCMIGIIIIPATLSIIIQIVINTFLGRNGNVIEGLFGLVAISLPLSVFIGLSFIPSLIITLCIHFYKKKHL